MAKKSDKDSAPEVDAAEDSVEIPKKSRFMELLSEALDGYEPAPPYPFDGYEDRIIEISAPDTADRALAIINLCDLKGDVQMKDVQPYIKALLGDTYDLIWPRFIGSFPVAVAIAFAFELQDWFFGDGSKKKGDEAREKIKAVKAGTDDLPGGSQGSSN